MTKRLVYKPKTTPRNAATEPLERLRENARRTPNMPVPLAHALAVLLTDQKRINRSRLQRIRRAWAMAVDQIDGINTEAALKAEVRSVTKTGEVRVVVSNPGLAHELGVVYRKALLEGMRELLNGKHSISGLVVQAGKRRR